MGYFEILMMIIVYSGLMTFFIVPFNKELSFFNAEQNQVAFKTAFKDNLKKLIFHKKAIFALSLFVLALWGIWEGYAAAEYHFNEHSGYPPISTNLEAMYIMSATFIYTISLYCFLAWIRTVKKHKKLIIH